MVKITDVEVEKIARLSQLELTSEEKRMFTQQLSDILTFAQHLAQVNTDGVPPTISVLDLVNVWRDDEVKEWLSREEALAEAAVVEDGCFKVPRIMDEE
ncbi:MAG TPA: Asp-tRNA(Asn)/Glu-tRNA(Gln) amidotransferase subunit GatC [Firmicutes bacterium]|nr:Asp-tRNA(Asn)/Glu-tRNA(Gln) amidotransferase subunit GatC [Bacillota bacterium]